MMEFDLVKNLEELANKANREVVKDNVVFNYLIAASLPVSAIKDFPLKDCTENAKLWQSLDRPIDFYFNHGEYIGDEGVEHIITELKNKPSSNRALYSLINQSNILGSGDFPIPSFMLMQCGIDQADLYCTVYFRALEIANFFRINLEEIRLTLSLICERHSNINNVNLTILAFKAYNKPDQPPLRKATLDTLSSLKISHLYEDDRQIFMSLLEQKSTQTTVVELDGLMAVKEWLSFPSKLHPSLNVNLTLINDKLDIVITKAKELKSQRVAHSHHEIINELSEKYTESMQRLITEFEKCP